MSGPRRTTDVYRRLSEAIAEVDRLHGVPDQQHRGRVAGLRDAARFLRGFDQSQEGWRIKFDRETVRNLAEGLTAMADSAERRAGEVPHGPDEPCTCAGCWACRGHEVGCTCDIDWDVVHRGANR